MGSNKNIRREADNEAKAVVKNMRISPQKLNLIATMIRKMDVSKALAALEFSRRRISSFTPLSFPVASQTNVMM